MEITTLDQVNAEDIIEIPVDGTDRIVKVEYLRTTRFGCEVGIRLGQLVYGWDHPQDTEVLILERG